MKKYGEMIRDIRQKAGISMGELARRLGFSTPYVCDVEYGRRAPFKDAGKVAEILGCDPKTLYEATMVSRGSVTLALKENCPDRHALLLKLSTEWDAMTEADCRRALWALRGKTRPKP